MRTVAPAAKRHCLAIAAVAWCAAILPAPAQDLSASLGKQRAAASRLEWEIREAGHPILGNIRFAYLKSAVETPVGNAKVFSRAYFSCQKATRKFAIELSNATAPDDPRGLRPSAEPRLYCSRPIQPWDEKLVQEEMLAHWDTNEIGDVMAQGLRPFPLRECVSIRVIQEVVLPAGWAQKTARVEFDLLPYNRELDSIFAACGEVSAYAPTPPAAPAAASAPAKPVATPAIAAAWQMARVLPGGRTNVRAGPRIDSAIVIQLDAGAVVLVQRTGNEWWRAKQSAGAPFDGYIRQDRLVFK
jgi:hypothetical protein